MAQVAESFPCWHEGLSQPLPPKKTPHRQKKNIHIKHMSNMRTHTHTQSVKETVNIHVTYLSPKSYQQFALIA